MNKEQMKELLDLNGQILVPKYAGKLKRYAKVIYYAGLFFTLLMLLDVLITLIAGAISLAILEAVFAFAFLVVVRMFCEFLLTHEG